MPTTLPMPPNARPLDRKRTLVLAIFGGLIAAAVTLWACASDPPTDPETRPCAQAALVHCEMLAP